MNPDQTASKDCSILIWVNIVCTIAYQRNKQMREKMTKVVTGGIKVNGHFFYTQPLLSALSKITCIGLRSYITI